MPFLTRLTKKIVNDAKDAVVDEVREKTQSISPAVIALGTICLGLYLGTRASTAKEITKTVVMIVDSRGIHTL